MGLEAKNEDFNCKVCALGKSKKVISRAKQEHTLQAGDFFHFDIQEVRPAGCWVDKGGRTISGFEYALVVIDDKTRMRTVILLRKKSDASEQLIRFDEYLKNLRKGVYPHEWRHDRDPSFNRFVDYLNETGQRDAPSASYIHEQNDLSGTSQIQAIWGLV